MQEARDSDARKRLYRDEYVTEASTSNLFVIQGEGCNPTAKRFDFAGNYEASRD